MTARPEPSRTPGAWRKHLGRKVSLRYRLHGDPQHPFSEAVGVVAAVDDDGVPTLQVVDRRGKRSAIPLDDVLVAKIFE